MSLPWKKRYLKGKSVEDFWNKYMTGVGIEIDGKELNIEPVATPIRKENYAADHPDLWEEITYPPAITIPASKRSVLYKTFEPYLDGGYAMLVLLEDIAPEDLVILKRKMLSMERKQLLATKE